MKNLYKQKKKGKKKQTGVNSACVKKGILQNLHKTSFEGSQKKKTIKKNCEVPISILVDEYTRCRFLLLLAMGTLVLQ